MTTVKKYIANMKRRNTARKTPIKARILCGGPFNGATVPLTCIAFGDGKTLTFSVGIHSGYYDGSTWVPALGSFGSATWANGGAA